VVIPQAGDTNSGAFRHPLGSCARRSRRVSVRADASTLRAFPAGGFVSTLQSHGSCGEGRNIDLGTTTAPRGPTQSACTNSPGLSHRRGCGGCESVAAGYDLPRGDPANEPPEVERRTCDPGGRDSENVRRHAGPADTTARLQGRSHVHGAVQHRKSTSLRPFEHTHSVRSRRGSAEPRLGLIGPKPSRVLHSVSTGGSRFSTASVTINPERVESRDVPDR
jgi:hypothetical protein